MARGRPLLKQFFDKNLQGSICGEVLEKQICWQWVLVLLAILIFQVGAHIPENIGESLDPSLLQFLLFPFVLLGFAYLKFGVHHIPRVLIALAVIGVTAGGVSAYKLQVVKTSEAYLTTRFKGDRFGSRSKRFRDELNRRLEIEGSLPAPHRHAQVTSHAEALELLREFPKLKSVVWRAADRLMISTREGIDDDENQAYRDYVHFRKRVKRGLDPDSNFQVVRDVPVWSIPLRPKKESIRFLGTVLSGEVEEDPVVQEGLLRAAESQESFWSGVDHRAYAALLLGNKYLDRGLSQYPLQYGDLRCAIETFGRGLGYVPAGKHPELRAALLNNKAIALAVKGFIDDDESELKRAKEHFNSGLQTAKQWNRYQLDYRAAYVSGLNLQRLKKMRQQSDDS